MKLRFSNRGYPKQLIDIEVEKVKFPCTPRKRNTKMKGILLVITQHPLLKDFASVIRKHLYIPLVISYHPLLKDFASVIRKHLYILYLNKQVKEIFTLGPVVSFQGAKKLGSYLVGAKLYLLERSI